LKIYTFYTETHKILHSYFIESLKQTNENLIPISDYFEQECDGSFMSNGWNNTMTKKVDQIINACKENDIFIHSDCDVFFKRDIYNDIIEELSDYDIAFQDDSVAGFCMGFFICKPSQIIIELFEDVKKNINVYGNDQIALNSIIQKYPIKYKKLSQKFFSYGQLNKGVWNNEDFSFPENISLIHANWTIGTENKLRLVEKLKNM